MEKKFEQRVAEYIAGCIRDGIYVITVVDTDGTDLMMINAWMNACTINAYYKRDLRPLVATYADICAETDVWDKFEKMYPEIADEDVDDDAVMRRFKDERTMIKSTIITIDDETGEVLDDDVEDKLLVYSEGLHTKGEFRIIQIPDDEKYNS